MDIQRAVDFLVSLFNPEADLLREYRNHPVHFFYNDNYLALPILQQYNRAEVADHIKSTLAYFRKPTTGNGRIEVWHRTRISYPPKYVETQLVHYAGGPVYLTEVTKSSIWQRGDEWKGYADMLLMGVVERWLEKKQYLDLWNSAKAMFNDNIGIVDKPFEKQHVKEDQGPLYETYKLALLLLTARVIGEPIDESRIREIISKMQAGNGGITTHYNAFLTPFGEQNVETTCFAIYATTS